MKTTIISRALAALLFCGCAFADDYSNSLGQSVKVILVQNNEAAAPLDSIPVPIAKPNYNIPGSANTRPLLSGSNVFTALGLLTFSGPCNRSILNDTPLAVYTSWGIGAKDPMIRIKSYDPSNPSRTRADAPFQIFYTAALPEGLPADASPFFQIVRSAVGGNQLALGRVISGNLPNGQYMMLNANLGTNIPLVANVLGTSVKRFFPLIADPSSPYSEETAEIFYIEDKAPDASVVGYTTVEVLPLPVATVSGIQNRVSDMNSLPTLTIDLQNLYPGHTTWATLIPSVGSPWISRPISGSSTGSISINLAEVLPVFGHGNNSVKLEVWSENVMAGWRNAVASDSDDAFGREQLLKIPPTFTIDISGKISINLNTL